MRNLLPLILFCYTLVSGALQAASPSIPAHPLLFEPTAKSGGFVSRGGAYSLRFTADGIDLSAPGSPRLRLSFEGSRRVTPVALGPSVSETNLFLGRDASTWRAGVPNYERIQYPGIYPGIDLVVYNSGGDFEYDLLVAPHADPSKIRMKVHGTADVSVGSGGDLLLGKSGFRLRQPRVSQEGHSIDGAFKVDANHTAAFQLGAYDVSKPLVIDPLITFSTYLGGSWADRALDVTVDKDGNVYVAGFTFSGDFPGPIAFGRQSNNQQYAFVAKYAPIVGGKTRLLFTNMLGPNMDSGLATAYAVAVDASGNIVLGGATNSNDLPVLNAVQNRVSGPIECPISNGSIRCADAFLTKFSPDGRTLLFSTYFGGRWENFFKDLAVDSAGNIYAFGLADARSDLDGTPDAVQQKPAGGTGFDLSLVRFSPTGQVLYSTYLGGTASEKDGALTVESPGVVWVASSTSSKDIASTVNAYQPTFAAFFYSGYVARIDTTKAGVAGLTYGTYFGRNGNLDVRQIFLDRSGQVVFCGANYLGLPATTATAMQGGAAGAPPPPADTFVSGRSTFTGGDGYIARLNPQLTAAAQLTYSSNVGGSEFDYAYGCALDAKGNFLVAGITLSLSPFLTTGSPLPYQKTTSGYNAFVIRIDPAVAGGRLESILFGGNSNDNVDAMAVDPTQSFAYLVGTTSSRQFPITSQAPQRVYGGDTLVGPNEVLSRLTGLGDAWLAQLDLVSPQVGPSAVGALQGDYQFGNPGTLLPLNPTAQMQDGKGTPVPLTGYSLNFAGTNASLGTASAITDTDGAVSTTVRIMQAGDATMTVSGPTGIAPFTFRFKGISGTLPRSAVILSGSAQSAASGARVPNPLVVELRDASNAAMPLAGVPVQFKANNVTVGAALAATVVETDGLGRASVPVNIGTKAGPMSVTVLVGSFPALVATFTSTSPAISAEGILNAATFLGGGVSPGLIITAFGSSIGPSPLQVAASANDKFPVTLGQTRILFDGVAAPLVYVSAGQTSAIVPYSVAGKASTQVVVEYQGIASNAVTIPVVAARPGLFSSNSSGTGQGALLNEDNSVNSATNPSKRGKIVVLFGTGEGETIPTGVDGQLASAVYPKPKLPVRVRIGGVNAEVLYAGAAPTLVAGVMQVNVRIPAGIPDGNAVVQLFVGDTQSPATVTISVRGD